MKRTVVRELIDHWVIQNRPDGLAKLAVKSNVSFSVIARARRGEPPGKPITRKAIASAIDVAEDVLFPPVELSGDGSNDVAS